MLTCIRIAALVLVAMTGGSALAAEGESNIFAGNIGNMIWTTIIFAIVLVILGKYAWPAIVKALAEREDAIRTSLENARKERIEAEKLLAEYRRQIDKSREEATAIVEEGRRDAAEVRRRIQDEARAEATLMIERARREIQLATDAAVKELYDRTADIAVGVASTVLAKALSPENHRELVSESLDRIRASASARRN